MVGIAVFGYSQFQMDNLYFWFKALHLVFMVSWFAGLLYIVRLFVYQREAHEKSESEKKILLPQFLLMSKRLWFGITWPAAILTLIFGLSMISLNPALMGAQWLQIKLVLLVFLYAYHLYCHSLFIQIKRGDTPLSSIQLRVLNECGTLFLFAIIFTAVLKTRLAWLQGVVGIVILALLIMAGIKIYRKVRKKN
jgi:putative membrane protein